MSNYFQKEILKYILILVKNISGLYIYELMDFLGISYSNKYIIDKGWIGRVIENYIIKKKFKGKICDLNFLNLELKTISLNYFNIPNNEVLLMSFKLCNFFKINFINLFFKIKKILWLPIIGKKNTFFLYRIVGNYFITILNKKNMCILFYELENIFNYILEKKIILNNYLSKNFKIQFIFLNKNKKHFFNLNNYYVRLYFNKNFLKNILLNRLY